MAYWKVGDTVKVRSDLSWHLNYRMFLKGNPEFFDENNTNNVTDDMLKYAGKECVIASASHQYTLRGIDGVWSWTDEMFEPPIASVEFSPSDQSIENLLNI